LLISSKWGSVHSEYHFDMARKTQTITTVTDDLTGEVLDERVKPTEFTYQGRTYRLDLGPESVRRLEEALKPFMDAAPSVAGRTRGPSDASAVRAWAIEQGLVEPGSRGRLSREVLAAYNEAHGTVR